tara:strand:- start:6211 stop:7191 length:981 start_codon:yes stop_codon:yes gene_type:complete
MTNTAKDQALILTVSGQDMITLKQDAEVIKYMLSMDAFWDKLSQDSSFPYGFKPSAAAKKIMLDHSGLMGANKGGSQPFIKSFVQQWKKMGKKSEENIELIAQRWIELLSNSPNNLFYVMAKSRPNEKVIPQIWVMVNELMFKDEIRYMLKDIEENNNEQIQSIINRHNEGVLAYFKQVDDEVYVDQRNEFLQPTQFRLSTGDMSKRAEELMDRYCVLPPEREITLTIDNKESLLGVLNSVMKQNGKMPLIVIDENSHIRNKVDKNIKDIKKLNSYLRSCHDKDVSSVREKVKKYVTTKLAGASLRERWSNLKNKMGLTSNRHHPH